MPTENVTKFSDETLAEFVSIHAREIGLDVHASSTDFEPGQLPRAVRAIKWTVRMEILAEQLTQLGCFGKSARQLKLPPRKFEAGDNPSACIKCPLSEACLIKERKEVPITSAKVASKPSIKPDIPATALAATNDKLEEGVVHEEMETNKAAAIDSSVANTASQRNKATPIDPDMDDWNLDVRPTFLRKPKQSSVSHEEITHGFGEDETPDVEIQWEILEDSPHKETIRDLARNGTHHIYVKSERYDFAPLTAIKHILTTRGDQRQRYIEFIKRTYKASELADLDHGLGEKNFKLLKPNPGTLGIAIANSIEEAADTQNPHSESDFIKKWGMTIQDATQLYVQLQRTSYKIPRRASFRDEYEDVAMASQIILNRGGTSRDSKPLDLQTIIYKSRTPRNQTYDQLVAHIVGPEPPARTEFEFNDLRNRITGDDFSSDGNKKMPCVKKARNREEYRFSDILHGFSAPIEALNILLSGNPTDIHTSVAEIEKLVSRIGSGKGSFCFNCPIESTRGPGCVLYDMFYVASYQIVVAARNFELAHSLVELIDFCELDKGPLVANDSNTRKNPLESLEFDTIEITPETPAIAIPFILFNKHYNHKWDLVGRFHLYHDNFTSASTKIFIPLDQRSRVFESYTLGHGSDQVLAETGIDIKQQGRIRQRFFQSLTYTLSVAELEEFNAMLSAYDVEPRFEEYSYEDYDRTTHIISSIDTILEINLRPLKGKIPLDNEVLLSNLQDFLSEIDIEYLSLEEALDNIGIHFNSESVNQSLRADFVNFLLGKDKGPKRLSFIYKFLFGMGIRRCNAEEGLVKGKGSLASLAEFVFDESKSATVIEGLMHPEFKSYPRLNTVTAILNTRRLFNSALEKIGYSTSRLSYSERKRLILRNIDRITNEILKFATIPTTRYPETPFGIADTSLDLRYLSDLGINEREVNDVITAAQNILAHIGLERSKKLDGQELFSRYTLQWDKLSADFGNQMLKVINPPLEP